MNIGGTYLKYEPFLFFSALGLVSSLLNENGTDMLFTGFDHFPQFHVHGRWRDIQIPGWILKASKS